jgi:hypothetical protein
MKRETRADYELFLRNGSSFILKDVKSLDVESGEDRVVNKLKIDGSNIKDKLVYLDISQIVSIVKRKEYKKWKK